LLVLKFVQQMLFRSQKRGLSFQQWKRNVSDVVTVHLDVLSVFLNSISKKTKCISVICVMTVRSMTFLQCVHQFVQVMQLGLLIMRK
ncbi:hypothetical protein AOA60_21705, partial [Pseudomonas sp. 2822-17]